MAKKITDLAVLTSVANNDLFIVEDVSATATKQITRSNFLLGVPVQAAFAPYSAMTTGTGVIPFDDTIPQNTEGDQVMSLAITPISATSTLLIEVSILCANTVAQDVVCALFQDANANALAAASQYPTTATARMQLSLRYSMTSGTTSSTTFKVRIGGNTAGTTTFNGFNSGRIYGTSIKSFLQVTEYQG